MPSICQCLSAAGDHVRSQLPGRPMNDSLAERNDLYVIDQVSTCLLAAGLPPCYWSFALTSTCHLLNVEIVDGESAWYNMHHLGGQSIPLGAYVHFKPSPTRDDTHKFAPRSMRGVIAGCELESGMRWSGKQIAGITHTHCHLVQDPSHNRYCEAETQNNRARRRSAILRIFGIWQGSWRTRNHCCRVY